MSSLSFYHFYHLVILRRHFIKLGLCFNLDELSRPIGSTKSFQTAFLPYLVMMIEKLFPCYSVLEYKAKTI